MSLTLTDYSRGGMFAVDRQTISGTNETTLYEMFVEEALGIIYVAIDMAIEVEGEMVHTRRVDKRIAIVEVYFYNATGTATGIKIVRAMDAEANRAHAIDSSPTNIAEFKVSVGGCTTNLRIDREGINFDTIESWRDVIGRNGYETQWVERLLRLSIAYLKMEMRATRATSVARVRHNLISYNGHTTLGWEKLSIECLRGILMLPYERIYLGCETIKVAIDCGMPVWMRDIQGTAITVGSHLDTAHPTTFGSMHLDVLDAKRSHIKPGMIMITTQFAI